MARTPAMRSGLWIRIGGSLVVLGALLWFLPLGDLVAVAGRISPGAWLGVLAGFLLGHLLGAFKWTYLLRRMGVPAGWRTGGSCYSLGLFANLCLPGIVGGDVVRAAALTRRTGRVEAVALAGIGDRLLDVTALGLVLAGGVAAVGAQQGATARRLLLVLALAAVVGLLSLGALLRRPLERWPARLRRRAGRFLVAARKLARRPGAVVVSLVSALAIQGGFVLLNSALGWSLGIRAPLAAWFVAWPLAKLAGLLPISLGGLGVRDAAFGSLLAGFGVPAAAGVVVSLLWQSVLVAGGLIAGGVGWAVAGVSPAEARAVADRAGVEGSEEGVEGE